MMNFNFQWFDKNTRLEQLDDHISKVQRARFGSEEMDESQKADRVRRHFDSIAAKYDFMNTLLSMGVHYLWKHQAVRMMHLKPGDKVLDVCGGTGDLSILADRKIGSTGEAVVYDINWEMMTAGRRKPTNREHRMRINYIQGDAEKISFPDNTFDAVMIGFAVRNITHMVQAFTEMHRVLKPGGTFLCLEFSQPTIPWFRWLYDFYSFHIMPRIGEMLVGSRQAYLCLPETIRLFLLPDELSELFERVGFTDVRYRRLTNGIAVAHLGSK